MSILDSLAGTVQLTTITDHHYIAVDKRVWIIERHADGTMEPTPARLMIFYQVQQAAPMGMHLIGLMR